MGNQQGESRTPAARRTWRFEFGDWLGRHYVEKEKALELLAGICAICSGEHGLEIAYQSPSEKSPGLARDLNSALEQTGEGAWGVSLLLHRRSSQAGHAVTHLEVRFRDHEVELTLTGNPSRCWRFTEQSAGERQAIREFAADLGDAC